MPGTKAAWTPERRAKHAEVMRRLNCNPEFIAKRNAGMKSEFNRIRKGHLMRKLVRRRREDPAFMRKWLVSISAVNATPERRAQSRATLAALKRFVAQEFDDPKRAAARKRRAAKAVITRRGGIVPPELLPLWNTIRPKVGAAEAMRIIKAEMARQ